MLTDNAAILYRVQLAGGKVPAERWQAISDYAIEFFPKTGLGFADIHAALAHAMAGKLEALKAIIENPAGPAADLVREMAAAFEAIAKQDWSTAIDHLTASLGDHARIGGSRAQRDLLEHALLSCLLEQGHADEARRLLALQRPVQAGNHPVAGL